MYNLRVFRIWRRCNKFFTHTFVSWFFFTLWHIYRMGFQQHVVSWGGFKNMVEMLQITLRHIYRMGFQQYEIYRVKFKGLRKMRQVQDNPGYKTFRWHFWKTIRRHFTKILDGTFKGLDLCGVFWGSCDSEWVFFKVFRWNGLKILIPNTREKVKSDF